MMSNSTSSRRSPCLQHSSATSQVCGSFLQDTTAVLLSSEGHISIRFFCVLVVEVYVCPGHGENDVRGWMTVFIFTKDNAANEKTDGTLPRQTRGRVTAATWTGQTVHFTRNKQSCKVPKIRNCEQKISDKAGKSVENKK